MGGLVARMYVQGKAYKVEAGSGVSVVAVPYDNDIDMFLMLGTPNGGSALPYWMIEGGDPETADDLGYPLTQGVGGIDFYQNTTDGAMRDLTNAVSPPGPEQISFGGWRSSPIPARCRRRASSPYRSTAPRPSLASLGLDENHHTPL